MKVFRKRIFCAGKGISEAECDKSRTWPSECDGAECTVSGKMLGKNGSLYLCNDEWCEEVCDITREEDREQMKSWKIGTEHVIRKNGKDVRVVVSKFEFGEHSCSNCVADGACYGVVPCIVSERTAGGDVYFKEVKERNANLLYSSSSSVQNAT
jgi:hypothetical protein